MENLRSATTKLDPKRYQRLLSKAMPVVIETEEQNEKALAFVEKLMAKGERINVEEEALLRLLTKLIQDFEERFYAPPELSPHEILLHLMDARGIKQNELTKLFGSKGVASEVINGKRGISKTQARALADFFHVTADLFI